MSDDTARALGAGGSTVTIADKECTVRPLSVRELAEAERICVEEYKDQYLETVGRNIKRLPERGRRNSFMEEELMKAAAWTARDLPSAKAYDSTRVKLSAALKTWTKNAFDLNGKTKDDDVKRYVATALDQGMLDESDYTIMAGSAAPSVKIGYVNWWITGTVEGQVTMIWLCFRDNGVTRDEVATAMGTHNKGMLVKIIQEIERLSSPAVGNG